MPNNDLEGNMSHFILIVRTHKKILCFQKLHFKFLELQNCIWGSRIQDPVSFPALPSNTGSDTKDEEIRRSPGTPEINLKCEEKSNIVYMISTMKQSKTVKQNNQLNPEDSRLGLTRKRLSEEHDENKMAEYENSDKKQEVKNCNQEPPTSEPKITGEETIMCQIFDHKKQKFVRQKSPAQPMVLCQIQLFEPQEEFKQTKVPVGRFLADTGAQINVGNYTLLDLLGIRRNKLRKYTWPETEIRINGIGGDVEGIRGINVRIHSVKNDTTVPAMFYITDKVTCNILSETLLYELGYINRDAFSEKLIDGYNNQEDLIKKIGLRTFGAVNNYLVKKICSDSEPEDEYESDDSSTFTLVDPAYFKKYGGPLVFKPKRKRKMEADEHPPSRSKPTKNHELRPWMMGQPQLQTKEFPNLENLTDCLNHIQKAMNKEDSSGIKQTNAQIEDSSELKNMDNKIIKKNHEDIVMQTPDENPGSEIASWADEMDRSTPLTHIEPTPAPVKLPANRLTLNNPTRSPSQPVTNRRETPSTLNKLTDYERSCMTTRSQEGHFHDDRNSHMTLQPDEDYSVTTGSRDK